jgi:ERCC4-type nuclease
MISVSIDVREHSLITALESEYLKKECGHMFFDLIQLEIGDIQMKLNENVLCLIERKTLADYASSITDGRSKNQLIRIKKLRQENPKMLIIYLIEGENTDKDYKYRNGVKRDSLYTSFVNKVIRDNFTIYRTFDINDSALIVTKIYDRLVAELKNESSLSNVDNPETLKFKTTSNDDYLKTIKLSKKENMTPQNCYICQLAQIPGISIDIARTIANKYKSFKTLLEAYQKCKGNVERENMMSEITIQLNGEKTRRLGNILSKKIYDYVYNCDNDGNDDDKEPQNPIPKLTLKLKHVV